MLSCLDTADRDGTFLVDSATALLQNAMFPAEKNWQLDLDGANRCAGRVDRLCENREKTRWSSAILFIPTPSVTTRPRSFTVSVWPPLTAVWRRPATSSPRWRRGIRSFTRGHCRCENLSLRLCHVPVHVLRNSLSRTALGREGEGKMLLFLPVVGLEIGLVWAALAWAVRF